METVSPLRMVGRGLRRRCPSCGRRWAFASWLDPQPSCASCGLRIDRGEGDFFLGAYTINFVTAELLLVVFLALVAIITWPTVPWGFIEYGGLALMVVGPILFFPTSRTLWLAIDLALREARPDDYEPRTGP